MLSQAFFDIDGFHLKVSVAGNVDTVAIVIGCSEFDKKLFSDDLSKNIKLIFMDVRYFAKHKDTETPEMFTIEKITYDIETIINDLSLEKVIIIGHSIHAFMALECMKKFPKKISKLVLIAASPIAGQELVKIADRDFNESICPERKALFKTKMSSYKNDKDSLATKMIAYTPMLWYDFSYDSSKLWQDIYVSEVGASVIFGSLFTNYKIEESLKIIECPIFLALGRYDYFNPPHLWENYRKFCKNLTINIFEKSGHYPQFEERDNFNASLICWIDQTK